MPLGFSHPKIPASAAQVLQEFIVRISIALIGLSILAVPVFADTLKPFATDGCSLWIDGPPGNPNLWRHCCVAHDLAYWIGGTEEQRKQADEAMKLCIRHAQQPMIASHTYNSVRMGGGPYWPSTYRWGYGWHYLEGIWPRGYKVPSPDEQAQIQRMMPAALQVIAADALQHQPKKMHSALGSSHSSTISSASSR